MLPGKRFTRRYYPLHHFILYPLLFAMCCICAWKAVYRPDEKLIWICMLALTLLVSLVSFITRQHYGLHNQNRIIRLEMRLRYHILTGRRFELVEVKLQPKQIFALRYASDEELPGLVDRAINEKLSPSQIRDSIVHWKADDMRV